MSYGFTVKQMMSNVRGEYPNPNELYVGNNFLLNVRGYYELLDFFFLLEMGGLKCLINKSDLCKTFLTF